MVATIPSLNSLWKTVYMMGLARELRRAIHWTMAMEKGERGGQEGMNERQT